jgi:hypothetical protein
MTSEPFGWGGLAMTIPGLLRETLVDLFGEPNVQALESTGAADARAELQRSADAAEAERFRLELERDASGAGCDWPDGS